MRYRITLQYKDSRIPVRESTVDRLTDDAARAEALRWSRLVCNAAGAADPKPVVWWLSKWGANSRFWVIDADQIPETVQK